jgi:hypothetical protein
VPKSGGHHRRYFRSARPYHSGVNRIESNPLWNRRDFDGDGDEPISDDELTALALAADPEQAVSSDAVPLPLYHDLQPQSLPLSYMPPAMRTADGWRAPVVVAIVVSLLLIDALGLCITYGNLVGA